MKNDTDKFNRELAEMKEELASIRTELESIAERKQSTRANAEGFLNASQVLAKIFPDKDSRPSDRWLRRLAQAGEVRSTRLGGAVFFKLSEVQADLKEPTENDIASMDLQARIEYQASLKTAQERQAFYQEHVLPLLRPQS